ncbi:NAD-dependent succinate-semialdehyde dehydrogenase [Pseudonocardia pini]|uniref:NAD-dependent succinate-semialdehyde dehydrogenase n=1 Tax=Pseudonocardia pini TaxID=2758030 RepID=UPI0015F07F16|nr:NAD-dependent succinate-semialdehyde dehydrogenase [Pseudonocardia pini]
MTFPNPVPTGLYLDGGWRAAADGASLVVTDPATEERVAEVAAASETDVDAAVESARAGFAAWRRTDPWTRSGVLRRTAELLRAWAAEAAAVMTAEQGKPLAEATAEFLATADQFDWYADEARRVYGRTVDGHSTSQRITVRREPVGVVAAFSAWNFPALLPSRKIAPALAVGCSIIVTAAEEAPLSTQVVAAALHRAGLPAGVLSVLVGDSAAISARLLASPVVRKLSLTGSVPVGRILLHTAADRILKTSMELGGHAPVLVFPDVDVSAVAELCAKAKFRNTGQVCASPSRFVVHESIHAEFVDAFVAATSKLEVGPGSDPNTSVGPLSNARRVAAAEHLVADAVSRGARVAAGGGRDDRFTKGHFFRPTVLTDVPADAAVLHEEPFAPVAPVLTFADLDEALAVANGTELGLASYVFTGDLRTAFLASEGIEAGMVGVNTLALATAEAPFGGVKQSGFGREGGAEGVEDYTTVKYVNMELA